MQASRNILKSLEGVTWAGVSVPQPSEPAPVTSRSRDEIQEVA